MYLYVVWISDVLLDTINVAGSNNDRVYLNSFVAGSIWFNATHVVQSILSYGFSA